MDWREELRALLENDVLRAMDGQVVGSDEKMLELIGDKLVQALGMVMDKQNRIIHSTNGSHMYALGQCEGAGAICGCGKPAIGRGWLNPVGEHGLWLCDEHLATYIQVEKEQRDEMEN